MDVWYLDTGIFVTPLLKNKEPQIIQECRIWQERVKNKQIQALTSYLTWDEVTYIAGRASGAYNPQKAEEAGSLFLVLPHLCFIAVGDDVVRKAQSLLKQFGWKLRDCIHASSALLYASGNLVTLDSDFWERSERLSTIGLKVVDLGRPRL